MNNFKLMAIISLALLLDVSAQKLVDAEATKETQKLYKTLLKTSEKGFMFGHQDALSYGIGWDYVPNAEPKSDVKEVCGDHPAIFGWDLGHIEIGASQNLDSVNFETIRKNIQFAHKMGAINTISWHSNNPVTGGNTWDKTSAVTHILVGGTHHELFKSYLNKVATFLNSLVDEKGVPIPIIFRPYHEHNGNWFWWGLDNASKSDYISLWKFTVTYLKQVKRVHHILYAYSPNLYQSEYEYLDRYPGDDFVDILGLDIYDMPEYKIDYKTELPKNIKILANVAKKKKKVYALTETGYNTIPKNDWWTESLLKSISRSGIAWVLVWRNRKAEHFFAPYKGHTSEKSFLEFYNSEETFFSKDLKK